MCLPVPLLEHPARATETRSASLSGTSAGSVPGPFRPLRRTVSGAIAAAEAPTIAKASATVKHALAPEEIDDAPDDQQPPGDASSRVVHRHIGQHRIHRSALSCAMEHPRAPFESPAIHDRHLLSTVRPQCGDAVKPARKCEGGTEGASGGGGGFTATGGVAFGSEGTGHEEVDHRSPSPPSPRSGRHPLRERSDRHPLKPRSG